MEDAKKALTRATRSVLKNHGLQDSTLVGWRYNHRRISGRLGELLCV
jgi:hypothetical protein